MPAFTAYKLPACYLILLFAGFSIFGAVIPGEFVVDDRLWAVSQSTAGGGAQVLQAFGTWIYRPLQGLFLNIALQILGASAPGFHSLSIFLHVLNSVLLFLLLGRLLPQLALSLRLGATLLFTVQPAGSEAVLWISAMSELTVMLAMLGTFLLYLQWRQAWSPVRVATISILFLVACLFKETAIMLPLVVIAYELSQEASERRLPKMLVATVLAAPVLFILLRYATLGSLVGGVEINLNLARVIEFALSHIRFIWIPGAPQYALRPPEISLASPLLVCAAFALFVTAVAFCWRLKANPSAVVIGLSWLGLALWPAYAVALIGDGYFNGRQAYIASAGVPIIIAALLDRLPGHKRQTVLLCLVSILLWMAYGTVRNALVWRSNLEVYRQAVSVSPSADGPRAGVASALLERGDTAGAVAMYYEALSRASSPQYRGEYLYALASILGQNGQTAESERLLHDLVRLEPNNSSAWAGLGNNAWMDGRVEEAAAYYRRAVELNPANAEAINNLASMLADSGPAYAIEAAKWRLRAEAMARKRPQAQELR